jgi:DNA helicase-2/ATP-dependent DNA helicase PcrA
VSARTFHAAALAQLRHFWPSRHGGAALPEILDSKARMLVPLIRRLPGGYRFTPARDVADAIERAKARLVRPRDWLAAGLEAPIPAELFVSLYEDYERAKGRAGLIDFEDMLGLTVELLETDAAAAELVRSRKRWFSVDEYQDTNALQERLLRAWLGASPDAAAPDLAVVGDPDQTIYTFTGATAEFLLSFERRWSGARTVVLAENYRSTPQILALANRLVADGPRGALVAVEAAGPEPTLDRYPDDAAEVAGLIASIRRLVAGGMPASQIAVLVRINAQLPPIELALTRARVPYTLRGQRFFARREVLDARAVLARGAREPAGAALRARAEVLFVEELGLDALGTEGGPEARERAASLELLLALLDDFLAATPGGDGTAFLAELDARAAAEAAALESGEPGVVLSTYHRAKGLEWDAVFLPALEEGLLPIRQAHDVEALAEERRLLYVGITRARRQLALSWTEERAGPKGGLQRRAPSRFLREVLPPRPRATWVGPTVSAATRAVPLPTLSAEGADDEARFQALRAWRTERAKADAMPAYVVAHDSVLRAIAEARPISLAALRRVPGMGPMKLEKYGDELLAVIAQSRDEGG